MPLSFEPNRGQAARGVEFLSRGSGYALSLAPGEVVLNLGQQNPAAADTLRMRLVGANAGSHATGAARQTGVVSYFIGNDPKQWRTGIPTYGKVDYAEVYPGVDLVFYGNQRHLEYDFVVAPGADPGRIAWRIDGARPAIGPEGNLTLRAHHGPATFLKPVVYQMDGGRKTSIEASFAVAGDQVRFRIGAYDHSKPLVIDPVLTYATYLAGTGSDYIGQPTGPGSAESSSQGIAVDASGSVYVTGRTTSTDFPTKNAYQSTERPKGTSAPSVFVTKFSPDGESLVYSTYIGGTSWDYAYAIAVDSSGSAYVTGDTNSNDFPITSRAYQILCSPSPSTPPGTVTQASCNSSNSSAFVTKLNPAGTGLAYSTFLGGYGWSYGTAIAVDSAGRAYVAGNESAPCNLSYSFPACFPTTSGATIPTSAASNVALWTFAAVFDPAGANLLYSTLFGDLNGLKTSTTTSRGGVLATGITVDSNGYFYLIGDTTAGKLPGTAGAYQPSGAPLDGTGSFVTAWRGFIAKFYPVTLNTGAYLAACTYLGGKTGNTGDYLSGITIDSSGNVYVVGYTNSTDFPVTAGAYSTVCGPGGGTCAGGHVTKLSATLSAASWSTYVGGSRQDGGDNLRYTGPIQLDGQGNVYITGQANPNFPLFNSVEPAVCCSGGQVVVELDPTGSNLLFSTSIGSGGKDSMGTGGLVVDSAGDIYVAGNNVGADLITTPGAFQTTNPSPVPTCCYHGFVAKITPSSVPTLQPGTLANGATYAAGGLVPGSWAQVKGANLATTNRIWTTQDFTGLGANLPTNLSGTQVMVNGAAAAVYYISSAQVNFQVPAGISGTASVQVIANGATSNIVSAPVVSNAPGIFPVTLGGLNYAAAVFLDGKIAADPSNGSSFRNAVPGDIVQLYATGLVPSPAGTLTTLTYVSGVTVTLGGVTIPAMAAALVAPGEFQVNFTVPSSFASQPSGVYPITISVNGATSPATINSAAPGPVVLPIAH